MTEKLKTKDSIAAGLNNWQKHFVKLALLLLASDTLPLAVSTLVFAPFLIFAVVTQQFLIVLTAGAAAAILVFIPVKAQCSMAFVRVCVRIDNGEDPGMAVCFKELALRFDMLLPAVLLVIIDSIAFFFLFLLPLLASSVAMAALWLPPDAVFPAQVENILGLIRNPLTALFVGTAAMVLVCIYFYVMLRMYFCYFLLALGFVGVVSSIKESFRITKGRLWELGIFFTVASLIMLAGSIGGILIYVIASPIYQLSLLRACRTLQGFAKKEA